MSAVRRVIVTSVLLGAWQAGASTATAQAVPRDRLVGFYLYTSGVDAYGNATPVEPLRREIDVYQNSAQRNALRLQNSGLRPARRGGLIPFALPADQLRRNRDPLQQQPLMPFRMDTARRQSDRIQAVRTYGGFGERSTGAYGSEVQRAFARRHDLVTASATTAPVFRANLRHASVAGMLASIDTTPFDERGIDLAQEPAVELRKALAEGVERSHRRIVREGWEWYKEEEYHRAIRSFESAEVLAPSDSLPRIGEVFSLIGIGSVNTAHVALRGLHRRDPNPFLHPINVATLLEDRQRVALLRIQTRMPSDAPRVNPDVAGMHAFVLWYLGERQEALSVASAIAEESPGSRYADWASKMQLAIEAIPPPPNQP